MKPQIIFFILFFCGAVVLAQDSYTEKDIIQCIYEGFDDGGFEYQKAVEEYEKLLISEKLLEDSSSKSYFKLVQKIASDESFDKTPTKIFPYLKPENKELRNHIHKCVTDQNKPSKLSELDKVVDSISKSNYSEPDAIARGILSVLSEGDFNKTLYRIKVFALLIWIETQ